MPLYEYQCEDHGRFEAFASMDQHRSPSNCPNCQRESRRVVSVPALRTMDRSRVAAMDRNEKSRQEPHVCRSGCSHQHKPPSQKKTSEKPVLQQYKGARPWVVEHA